MADHLTKEEISHLKKFFNTIDKEGEDEITAEKFRIFLSSFSFQPTDRELKEMLGIDAASNGRLNFDQFSKIMSQQLRMDYSDDEFKTGFEIFDKNNDGFITAKDLQHVMIKLGVFITMEEAKEMILEEDFDGDGQVSFEEFVRLINNN